MSLRLILGRAGSGKSTHIYREISQLVDADPHGEPLWLLVPEQSTSQAERNLSAAEATPGLMRARVVSFQRLAYRLLHEVAGAALVQVGELGRHMIIRRVIEQHKQELRTFSRAANQPGFTRKLAELVAELKSCQVTAEDLQAVLDEQGDKLTPTLQNKLHDLVLLCEHLAEEYGDTYLDSGDCLHLLAENLPHASSLAGRPIWLDGFNGFTAQEYTVIEQMLQVCPQVSVSLTLPPGLLQRRLRDEDAFFTPWSTARELIQRAERLGIEVEPPVIPAAASLRSQSNRALQYLESNYFDRLQAAFPDPPQGLKLIAASNRRAEVEAAAAEIIRLCREEGYRFRDISITLRDFANYDYLLSTVLTDHGIPHFLDQKRAVEQHPALELVRSGLEVVLENFLYEPVFRCLKTDLFPVSREQVDILENYVLASGIRGSKRWLDQADWVPRNEPSTEGDSQRREVAVAQLNQTRRTVAKRLGRLDSALRTASTVKEYATAVYLWLAELQVAETLYDWAEQSAQRGELEAASLHTQVWAALVGLLDEMVAGLGEEQLPLAEFARILDSGLESIELGLIPPELDQVVITSLGRSRHPEVKAALVLGITEGVLPARINADGLFTDYERQVLANCQLELGPSLERRLFDEQYLIYLALTRPSQQLWLSYPVADEEGAALLPSSVVKRVQEMFPLLTVKEHALMPEGVDNRAALPYLSHPLPALRQLAAILREARQKRPVATIWWDVYSHLLFSSAQRPALLQLLASMERKNSEGNLAPTLVRRLYGRTLRASVSRIERYNACPFAFFTTYGLRLQQRAIHQLAAPDLGTFFHDAMDRFVMELQQRQLNWGELTDQQYNDLTASIVADLAPELQNHILDSSSRFRHIAKKLQRTVERSARILGRHASQGQFRPVAMELAFGPGGSIPGLSFTLSDGTRLELAGRIDRLDVATAESGQSYLRVIDYKSGSSRLTPVEVYYGLKLQLLTYLHVAQQCAARLLPEGTQEAGALYFRIHDPLLRANAPLPEDVAENQGLEAYRMSGWLLDDAEAISLMDNTISGRSLLIPVSVNQNGTLRQSDSVWSKTELDLMRQHLEAEFVAAGEGILAGNISIAPYRLDQQTACRFCPYAAVCQFDPLLPENSYRWLNKLPREEIIARLQPESIPHGPAESPGGDLS
ncbi:MAG: helicase-exonuclease AddAB subunit AddB [Bacillota bacterium]